MKVLLEVIFLILTVLGGLATLVSVGLAIIADERGMQNMMLMLSLVCLIWWGISSYILNYIRDSF